MNYLQVNSLVVFGFHNTISYDNLYALTFQHRARDAYEDFKNSLNFYARSKVLRRIYATNKQEIWLQFIFSSLAALVNFASPVFQQLFLGYFEDPAGRPIKIAYMYVFGLFMVGMTKLICNNIQLYAGRRWNVRCFIQLDAELFAKTLHRKDASGRIDEEEKEEKGKDGDKKDDKKEDKEEKEKENDFSSVGKITNLMSVDAEMLANITQMIFVSDILILMLYS